MKSTNPRDVGYIFRNYARKIHARASPADPNYLGICAMWGKIEAWVEHHFPSFITFDGGKPSYSPADPRSRIIDRYRDLEKENIMKRGISYRQAQPTPWQLYVFVLAMTVLLFLATGLSLSGMLYWFYGETWTWRDLGAVVNKKMADATARYAQAQKVSR